MTNKILKPVILLLIILLLYGPNIIVFGQEITDSPKTIDELSKAIELVMKETNTPAVGIALVDSTGPIWVKGMGKANLERNIDASLNTMFRVGSVSKMLVALALLKLQEEGKLSLTDKIKDLAPEIDFINPWQNSSPILVEHLLEHTTGWDDVHTAEFAKNDPKLIGLRDILAFHPHTRTSRWVPGTRMAYSNWGPVVAAYIVEKKSGQPFHTYIQNIFFNSLGMDNSTYFFSNEYRELGASLYINEQPQDYWNILVWPSGSLNSSPKDMSKLVQFFIRRGKVDSLKIISQKSFDRMETPTSSLGAKGGLEYGSGLSNYSTPFESFIYRSHNGGVNGGFAELAYLPDHNIGYAIMINSASSKAFRQIIHLIRSYQTHQLQNKPIRKHIKLNQEQKSLVGYYTSINPRNQVFYFLERILKIQRITQSGDTLIRQGMMGGRIKKSLAISDGLFISPESGLINMVQVDDPTAGECLDTTLQYLKKTPTIFVFAQLTVAVLWLISILISIISGLILLVKYLISKSSVQNIIIHKWSTLPSMSILFIVIIFIVSPFDELGIVSIWSMTIFLATIAYAILSLISIVNIIKQKSSAMSKLGYCYYALLSALNGVVTYYLLIHGVVGIRTWS